MSNAAEADTPAAALEARLRQVLGNDHVLTDPEDRQFFSSDVFREAEPAAFVIQPGSPEELADAAKAASGDGLCRHSARWRIVLHRRVFASDAKVGGGRSAAAEPDRRNQRRGYVCRRRKRLHVAAGL